MPKKSQAPARLPLHEWEVLFSVPPAGMKDPRCVGAVFGYFLNRVAQVLQKHQGDKTDAHDGWTAGQALANFRFACQELPLTARQECEALIAEVEGWNRCFAFGQGMTFSTAASQDGGPYQKRALDAILALPFRDLFRGPFVCREDVRTQRLVVTYHGQSAQPLPLVETQAPAPATGETPPPHAANGRDAGTPAQGAGTETVEFDPHKAIGSFWTTKNKSLHFSVQENGKRLGEVVFTSETKIRKLAWMLLGKHPKPCSIGEIVREVYSRTELEEHQNSNNTIRSLIEDLRKKLVKTGIPRNVLSDIPAASKITKTTKIGLHLCDISDLDKKHAESKA